MRRQTLATWRPESLLSLSVLVKQSRPWAGSLDPAPTPSGPGVWSPDPRGLTAVALVTSDAHAGLVTAIGSHFRGERQPQLLFQGVDASHPPQANVGLAPLSMNGRPTVQDELETPRGPLP